LDFGAVDVIYNRAQDKAYVLEVNTAPGLEGSTLDNYVEAIQKVL
jgi:D-alanine-D-alanine ligase-like ATP-grasp enzyme